MPEQSDLDIELAAEFESEFRWDDIDVTDELEAMFIGSLKAPF